MIDIKDCGHSVETSGRWHLAHPNRCYYCEYVVLHPRPKRARSQRQEASALLLGLARKRQKAKTVANHDVGELGA